MAPLPKKKHTRARRGNKNAHNAIKIPATSLCPCSRRLTIQPHRACPMCGNYKQRTVAGYFPMDNLLDSGDNITSSTENINPETASTDP